MTKRSRSIEIPRAVLENIPAFNAMDVEHVPPGFVVGGYPDAPNDSVLRLALRNNDEVHRLLKALRPVNRAWFKKHAALTVFVSGEWIGGRKP
jgi:hypothetical protein